MCGIAGILLSPSTTDPRQLAEIGPMTAHLRHRGPDGDGFWIDRQAGVALGHRRLAIIDLSETGRQPMVSRSGTLVATYNGEIYNFRDLRAELMDFGCHFQGHSDTEVMLAAFERFGLEAALQRLAGMFAIGLWDRDARTLHLVRDRLGKKPLYIAIVDGSLIFASELKAICAVSHFRPQLDPDALNQMLRHGWISDRQCIWANVLKLPAGSLLSISVDELATLDLEQLRQRMRTWWSFAEMAESAQLHPFDLPPDALEAELDRLLRVAVRERMVADVPLGALLSGGIDSATVVALMQAQSSRPIRTFTIGYLDTQYDEAKDAARVARFLGTDHTDLHLTADEAIAVIPDIPRIWDEPFGDESQIPTFLVSRLAREHVTVALTGDGGDEAFGGYTRHLLSSQLGPMLDLPLGLRHAGASVLTAFSAKSWEVALRHMPLPAKWSRPSSAEHLQKLASMIGAADERELYGRLVSVNQTTPMLKQMASGPTTSDNIAAPTLPDRTTRLMYRDAVAYLPGDVLVKLDRATMAVGLEGRCPLLDHRVVEFAWRLPQSVKIRGGRGKWILRRLLRRYLPDSLFERPKHGFNVPIAAWLRGPLRSWAEDLLSPSQITREGLLDPVRVREILKEHMSCRRDHAGALWAILMFEAWFETAQDLAQATAAKNPLSVNSPYCADSEGTSCAALLRDAPGRTTTPLQWGTVKIEAANGR